MDISLFRENNGKAVRDSQTKRGASSEIVDKIIELDTKWRQLCHNSNNANKEVGELSKEIAKIKKEDKNADISDLREKSLSVKETANKLDKEQKEILNERNELMDSIGNIVHDSVPFSLNESDFLVVKTVYSDRGTHNEHNKKHHELLYMIGGYEPEIGTKVAGHRGYYLTGCGFLLNQAIIQYGLHFLWQKGYQHVQTPFFMKQSIMKKVASLVEFDEGLYKVIGKDREDDPVYLIATSEQPITALNMDKTFFDKDLPLKYAGFSSCFRKEAGSHGKDIRGIFRVHQFEKIEQFVICKPSESWTMHQEMMNVSEEFYQSLGLSYRVINIPSGDLNNAASKKYDLEGWFPGQNAYRELVSCSNCTDYQSRRMNIKYENNGDYVHMLNSTLCATGRTICCILENYQTDTGIEIPEALQPYLAPYLKNSNIIPFVRKYDLKD